MVARMRLVAALGALIMAGVVVAHGVPPAGGGGTAVELRSTTVPISRASIVAGPETSRPYIYPRPFNACEDIPLDVIDSLGLAYTPPKPVDNLRCEFDAGNYQLSVEAFNWRSYDETLLPDAVETTVNGHRAAQYWIEKPSDWNSRWWVSCMLTFKTSYGVIQQALYYAAVYSEPKVDCPVENMVRATQLTPYYKF